MIIIVYDENACTSEDIDKTMENVIEMHDRRPHCKILYKTSSRKHIQEFKNLIKQDIVAANEITFEG
jgi:hypothetical protein